jgi:hypothetical protein
VLLAKLHQLLERILNGSVVAEIALTQLRELYKDSSSELAENSQPLRSSTVDQTNDHSIACTSPGLTESTQTRLDAMFHVPETFNFPQSPLSNVPVFGMPIGTTIMRQSNNQRLAMLNSMPSNSSQASRSRGFDFSTIDSGRAFTEPTNYSDHQSGDVNAGTSYMPHASDQRHWPPFQRLNEASRNTSRQFRQNATPVGNIPLPLQSESAATPNIASDMVTLGTGYSGADYGASSGLERGHAADDFIAFAAEQLYFQRHGPGLNDGNVDQNQGSFL